MALLHVSLTPCGRKEEDQNAFMMEERRHNSSIAFLMIFYCFKKRFVVLYPQFINILFNHNFPASRDNTTSRHIPRRRMIINNILLGLGTITNRIIKSHTITPITGSFTSLFGNFLNKSPILSIGAAINPATVSNGPPSSGAEG
jgi:hypothetical protein